MSHKNLNSAQKEGTVSVIKSKRCKNNDKISINNSIIRIIIKKDHRIMRYEKCLCCEYNLFNTFTNKKE
jgi:hypothetical protein